MITNQPSIERFWNAVLAQDYETVQKFIAEGFDVNVQIPGKVAPITFAQPAEDMVMLKILWAAGAHPATPWLEAVFADFASGGDGAKFKHQKGKSLGKFLLHRYNGIEEFVLEEAEMTIEPDGNNIWLVLEAITNGTVVRSLPDTEALNATPSAYLSVLLKDFQGKDLLEKHFSINEPRGDEEATIYYVEHQPLQENEIVFVSKKNSRYLVKWTALTTDVNDYNGTVPSTHLEIEGWFSLVKRS